ncbi:MAG: PhnD/SsuA/transferrin family substrate-binding protein [Sulfuricella sp.]|nr:PhnD/SsuA/transferrin family substrate-binding protein [Sulfuricella sp.]
MADNFFRIRSCLAWTSLLVLFALFSGESVAGNEPVRIGVITNRGLNAAQTMWGPLSGFLAREIPGQHFELVPVALADMDGAVARGDMDFAIVNSGQYVDMELRYGMSRIATLRNRVPGGSQTRYGGVLFTRADNRAIQHIADLKGKSLAIVDATSLGGWLMQWREMAAHGINPARDLAALKALGEHDAVVFAVLDGKADAGAVRSDVLERMAEAGLIRSDQIRVLDPRADAGFPFLHSTPLYPEWPFVKLRHTSDELAQKVAIALLRMPADCDTAKSANIAGWTVPLDYHSVHDLYRELQLGPYAESGKFTLADVIHRYWLPLGLGGALMLSIIAAMFFVARANRLLRISEQLSSGVVAELSRTQTYLRREQRLFIDGPVMVFLWQARESWPVEYVSPNIAQLGYHDRQLLSGMISFAELVHPDDIDRVTAEVGDFGAQGREYFEQEYRLLHADGTSRWYYDFTRIVRDPQGGITHYHGYLLDITERRGAEAALRASEESYRGLFDSVQDAIYIQAPDGSFLDVNEGAVKMYGYPREFFIGKLPDVLGPAGANDMEAVGAAFAKALAGAPQQFEFIGMRASGEVFPKEVHLFKGVYFGRDVVIALSQDITERKRVEEQLRKLNENLARNVSEEVAKNRTKDHLLIQQSRLAAMGEMIGNIAHQWRQPLNALGLILSNIRDAQAYNDLSEEYLEREVQTGRRLIEKMSTTIDDFRNFFRPNREKTTFSLAQAVRDTLNIVESAFRNNHVSVELQVDEDCEMLGFPNEYSQVLLNILSNAKDAIHERAVTDGKVSVRVGRGTQGAQVVISDNAGGIPPDVIGRIFDPYFTTRENGTGIGLYMSKMIIENNMNGHIEVRNGSYGAEFTITTPSGR